VTHELIAVINTTVVNTETMANCCEDRRGRLDRTDHAGAGHARYQHNAAVPGLGGTVGNHPPVPAVLLTELNLSNACGSSSTPRVVRRYHPTFADFQAAIQVTIDGLPTKHAEQLKTLMTLNFQQFKDVSLMAA